MRASTKNFRSIIFIADQSNTSYRDSFHNCTNIVILAHQEGVIPVLDTYS
ncbi:MULTISPECIES: hypothetical protein [Wolbachia]|nr:MULTISPECIES: hypothetical protein [Wolbachia]MBA8766618.1 hypothetical protein [Wolbachia pipientis]